jgi:protein-S-isoprenylcysteine O-methyltransferase Ste14
MAAERSNKVPWAVAIVVILLLLPVFAFFAGFSLVPMMAITAWSRSVWVSVAAIVILNAAIVAVLARRKTPAP